MLVISNGTPKSGTTWLRHIVHHMTAFEPIPDAYANVGWRRENASRSIHPPKLKTFLREADYSTVDYLSKNHIFSEKLRDLLLAQDHVYCVCALRDVKDTVVSHFYYQKKKRNWDFDFGQYYWKVGRYFANFIIDYANVWQIGHPKLEIVRYESLKEDFATECSRIGKFLGLDLSDEDVARIQSATAMQRMRKLEEGADGDPNAPFVQKGFFRKGEVGDWKNHFDEHMTEDFEKIQDRGLRGLDQIKYQVAYPWRKRLNDLYGIDFARKQMQSD